ncbi:MAG: dihydrodipicolinate synthase family protein [Anaerolineae bacterium]|nr:dihydrodipicolinate synthase family protein [Thermoflexales bacterium]MDW8406538.1 dihydrodipicolinate synthase family protein [Anaerolineae bacterium]
MTIPNWRGSFAIPMTPFDNQDRIDEDVLRAEVEFCVQAGVGGLMTPLLVSEFMALSEDERRLMMRVPVEQAKGRIPVIVNVAAENTPLAVGYARYAMEIGADGVIAMPPYALRPDWDVIFAYYQAISDAVSIPVWIQNAGIVSLTTDQLVKLCEEIEHVSWIKEEVEPSPRMIGALVARNSPYVHGVMGGVGGRYLITEWARGAKGCIHACQFCDVVQDIWNFLEVGRLNEAGDLFEKVLPGLVLEGMLGMAFSKEIMVRRGIFKNNRMRMQAHPLTTDDLREIDRVWERIQPYLHHM